MQNTNSTNPTKQSGCFNSDDVASMYRLMYLGGVLIAIMFLGACLTPTPTPIPTPTLTPTPTPTPTLFPGQFHLEFKKILPTQPTENIPIPGDPPNPILTFLVDRSDSMATKCADPDQMTSINARIIHFLTSLLGKSAEIKIIELPPKKDEHADIPFDDVPQKIEEIERKIQPKKGNENNE